MDFFSLTFACSLSILLRHLIAGGVEIERILTAGGDPAASLQAELRPSDFVVMGTTPLSADAQPWSSMPLERRSEWPLFSGLCPRLIPYWAGSFQRSAASSAI